MVKWKIVAYATILAFANIRANVAENTNGNRMDRIEKLKAFLVQNPEDSFVKHALALEYIKLERDAEARALFEAILERDESYIGTYYHLAKLLERNGEKEAAITWYEKGMKIARAARDNHAYNELQAAYEDLVY
jgi:Tfp pilus assembly protein PilF